MLEKERINAIKHSVDLVGLVQARGISLKKNGKGYTGRCPFHDDANPSLSVNPQKNLWQCFGCGKGGDVIRFVELHDQVDFKEAVQRLAAELPGNGTVKPPAQEKPGLSVKEKKLLAKVVSYYQHTLTTDPRGLEYLKGRGITDLAAIKDFGCGFANGTLKDILPEDEEVLACLKKIGILNQKGNETFYNSVVFPLQDAAGVVVNLYGRNIVNKNNIDHLYFPGPRSGLAPPAYSAVRRSDTVILTESIIDALTLYSQGFKNVVPAYGVNGFIADHLSLLHGGRTEVFNRRVKEVYLVFDTDEAGQKGAEAVAGQLRKNEISAHVVTLPEKDVNIYFSRHTPEEFEGLLTVANPKSLERSDKVSIRKETLFQEEEHGFTVAYGKRRYQIKGIHRAETQLKVTVKAVREEAGKQPFELTTIDLYSARSRQWFVKLCAELFTAPEELIKEDLGKILALVENWRPGESQEEAEKMSAEEQETALAFLKKADLFAEILSDFEILGVTGEETNKLVGYLAATSRKLSDPLSVLIQSRSAAGKSTLQDAILALIPDEDYVKYTRITDQALFYKDEDSLVNKILAIEEAEGMGGAAYSIRNIQSAKKITVAATGKDPGTGKMRTEEYTVKGPVAVLITTTQTEVDQETASRFIILTIDESTAMTEAIHKKQREAETLEGLIKSTKREAVIARHHAAQRLLAPLAVVNPFSKYLTYPDQNLRSRRDHKKYLGLIRAIAFSRQHQREIKTIEAEGQVVEYIEVTLDDIEIANQLANEVLGQSMDELAKPSRTLLGLIHNMVKAMAQDGPLDEVHFSRRMVREYTGWTDWQIRTHIKELLELEYIYARQGAWGKEYVYGLHCQAHGEESGRCYLDLMPVEKIKKMIETG